MPPLSTSHTTVFRVRGLPLLVDDALKAQLGAFIRQQLSLAENVPFTITCAPNCYNEQREKIALSNYSRESSERVLGIGRLDKIQLY
jgi:hypothetical protein